MKEGRKEGAEQLNVTLALKMKGSCIVMCIYSPSCLGGKIGCSLELRKGKKKNKMRERK